MPQHSQSHQPMTQQSTTLRKYDSQSYNMQHTLNNKNLLQQDDSPPQQQQHASQPTIEEAHQEDEGDLNGVSPVMAEEKKHFKLDEDEEEQPTDRPLIQEAAHHPEPEVTAQN